MLEQKNKSRIHHKNTEIEKTNDITIIKKDKNLISSFKIEMSDKSSLLNQSNILIDSLQEFYMKKQIEDEKEIKKLFVISFAKLISLIREAFRTQQKIDHLIFKNTKKTKYIIKDIKKINVKYMNDLIYDILSFNTNNFECGFNIKHKKKDKKEKKLIINNSKISANDINAIFENIYKEVFLSDKIKKKKFTKAKKNEDLTKTKIINDKQDILSILEHNNISPLIYKKIKKIYESKRQQCELQH